MNTKELTLSTLLTSLLVLLVTYYPQFFNYTVRMQTTKALQGTIPEMH